jgi:hypothetical protein
MNAKGKPVNWAKSVGMLLLAGTVALLSGCGRIAAVIQSYSPATQGTPLQVETGKPVEIKATVANTGSRAHKFIVKVQISSAGGLPVDDLTSTIDPALRPGETRTLTWSFTPEKKGLYLLQISVYKDENTLLARAPELPQAAILATEAAPQPSPTEQAAFKKGDRVRVTDNLNVRQGPSISQPEVTDPHYPGYMPAGSLGSVVDGPVQADGYTWWKVKFDRGVTGWCVEDGLKSLAELLGKKS